MGRQMQQQMNHQENRAGEGISSDAVFGKWLNSTGVQHVSASTNLQDCTNYGAQNRSRMFKTSRSVNGTMELYSEPSTPPLYSRSSSQRNMEGGLSPGELSPGIFDLHSIDTELLPEDSISGLHDSSSPLFPVMERDFENDSDVFTSASKQNVNRLRFPSDSSQLRVLGTDKEKAGAGAKIKVVVRKRPLNKKEILKKEDDIVTIEPDFAALTVNETKLKVDLTAYVEKHDFVFDAVLDEQVSNEEVYRVTVEPIVPAIFNRTKATCFAYGQTGSGKTYTMQPLPLKASEDILRLMQQVYVNQGFQLYVSFFEIYGGKLYDLLSERRKLCIREDGKQQVCVVGLQEFRVDDVETVKEFILKGNAARSTGSTGANEESSRSHAILQLVIKRSADGSESKPARLVGKLSFIDLAGSERGADTTDNDRQTRMEGAEINKSLLALKECIRALDNDQVHIPFRGSKLTEVLRDSFVGNSRTVMISCISPNSGSCEHTLNTLRYADRVKSLSKTSNSKKDTMRESSTAPFSQSLSMSLRESSSVPLSQSLPMSMRESSTAPLMLMRESSTTALTQPSSISMRESSTAHLTQSLSMSMRQSSNVPLTHSLSMSMRQSSTAPLTQPFSMSMRHSSATPLTQLPSMSMRQSSTAPLTQPLSSASPLHLHKAPENNRLDLPSDRNKFGWNKQSDGESCQHFAMDQGPPIGRDDGQMASLYADTGKTYKNALCNDSCTAQESQEQDKKVTLQSLLKGKPDRYQNQNSREETININHNATGDRRQLEASIFDYLVLKASSALPSSSSAPTHVPEVPLSVRDSGKRIANGTDADFITLSEHMERENLSIPDVNSSKSIAYGTAADFAVSAEHREREHLGRDSKQSRDDSFILKPKSVIPDGRSEVAPRNLLTKSRRLEERHSFGRLSAIVTDTKAGGGQKLSLVKLASLIETVVKEGAEKLDLQGRLLDQVEWLPDSIGKLTNLTEINLSENRIMTLPSSIQGLSMLTKLDLHANKLMDIPDAIGELSNLTILDAHGNCLQKVPASIGNLFRLACLDLSSNQLPSLPESIGQLVNLKILHVETNEIEELPYTIGQCASLTELRADFNHLKALPEAVGKLESLEVLTLHYNNIKSLPTTMDTLSSLRELDVSFNELEYLPESLCLATSLVKLNVSSNFADLQNLPRSIGNLEMLEEIDISNDQIKFLPDSFSMLTKLHTFHAEETPLEIPPKEIAGNGAEAVVQFMIEHVARRDDNVIENKPKWKWSMFCTCLRKRKREEAMHAV